MLHVDVVLLNAISVFILIDILMSLFKKMAHKRRAPVASTSAPNLPCKLDVPCFYPSCLVDPRHQADHQRNEDAHARDALHRAFGDVNLDPSRVGKNPSNPHVILSSLDTGDEPQASYDDQGNFRSSEAVRGSIRGFFFLQIVR
ncbi:hypothetical protein ZOSMA_44G01410 [Zostera marina]|uniref:Uncharacterized protein n=1 Tax=Zostera marina TaxID=29655 RepID=A0A0K9P189_ZOSMR|nr:hypothetical protein ZOSMA_44G01410 [Zostera marina]